MNRPVTRAPRFSTGLRPFPAICCLSAALAILVTASACKSRAGREAAPAAPPPQTAPALTAADTGVPIPARLRPLLEAREPLSTPLAAEIARATMRAYALEAQLYAAPQRAHSRDDVVRHYRRGFSVELADRLADYSWWPEGQALRMTESALAVPDSVVVLSIAGDEAVVAHRTPIALRDYWQFEDYMLVRLQREDGQWIIAEIVDTEVRPSALPAGPER
ncbi:MAG: hypothetical protein GTN62_10585 [Gemmatimonadales bacterium]|nr:hypothetical protein [Gemmatimonadales bacterium]NIN12010.1 hypothetical protein [Gemmatimonadales bacterium]NIN50541.1 hypothetical protein [Gemmatimonadales bacterium]NIP08005.1 hypothetical protein [Gemmatimonadales bacterium]NIR00607.1 hypothetical protein [Gemmatimonadales bacterium]